MGVGLRLLKRMKLRSICRSVSGSIHENKYADSGLEALLIIPKSYTDAQLRSSLRIGRMRGLLVILVDGFEVVLKTKVALASSIRAY